MTKTTSKIASSTSTTMIIAVILATTSRAKTHASPASSNGKVSANKSSNCGSVRNYHLVIWSKKRMGDVPCKSPGYKALVSPNSDTKKETFQMPSHLPFSLNLIIDNIFCNDVSMDSFVMSFGGEQDEPSLSIHQWKLVLRIVLIQEIILQPVLSFTMCTVQKIRTTNCGAITVVVEPLPL